MKTMVIYSVDFVSYSWLAPLKIEKWSRGISLRSIAHDKKKEPLEAICYLSSVQTAAAGQEDAFSKQNDQIKRKNKINL